MAITMRPNSMVMVSDVTMYAEFNCGSVEELSGFDSWNDIDLVDGCVTLCIPTGVFYSIYEGTWYNSDGSDAPTPEVASLNASPSMLGGMRLTNGLQMQPADDLTEQPEAEPEITEPEGGEEDAS